MIVNNDADMPQGFIEDDEETHEISLHIDDKGLSGPYILLAGEKLNISNSS